MICVDNYKISYGLLVIIATTIHIRISDVILARMGTSSMLSVPYLVVDLILVRLQMCLRLLTITTFFIRGFN